jgi:hypothetical protein
MMVVVAALALPPASACSRVVGAHMMEVMWGCVTTMEHVVCLSLKMGMRDAALGITQRHSIIKSMMHHNCSTCT